MNRQVIFIGGIHGVGKGTICKDIGSSKGFIHLSASNLLKWKEVSADEKNKRVMNIPDTQDRLIAGLNAAVKEGNRYFLDGHFCLLNALGKPERIPTDTFVKIAPIAIAVVVDKVEVIAKRLEDRDGRKYEYNTLDELQLSEIEYAKEISSTLAIPFVKIENGDIKELIDLIARLN